MLAAAASAWLVEMTAAGASATTAAVVVVSLVSATGAAAEFVAITITGSLVAASAGALVWEMAACCSANAPNIETINNFGFIPILLLWFMSFRPVDRIMS